MMLSYVRIYEKYMSFYLSYTRNLKTRKAPHVFYFKDKVLCMLSDKIETEIATIDTNNQNPIIPVLNFIQLQSISDSEILLPSLDDNLLDEACDAVSKYLFENDVSIGILTFNPNFRKDYYWLLDKYGITYSVPRIRPTHGVCEASGESKPKKKPGYKKEGTADVEDAIKTLKVCSPKRPEIEDDLESGLVMDEPFNSKLVKLLNESGKSNVEVYTKGGISRQVFSNILSKKDIIPKKDTVICLIIGMELNYIDGINLLACAGYALSKSIPQDAVVNKYLKRGIYDLNRINDELDERGCQLLGWKPRDN